MRNKEKAILGIGNALVDVLVQLKDDKILNQFGLAKGSMTLVDASQSQTIQNTISDYSKVIQTGGSAANTIHGIAKLGGKCGYLGKISDDEMGQFFDDDFKRNQIKTHLMKSPTGTGVATTLISSDSERTFGTYLGAALELNAEEIITDIFDNYDIVHIEGYLVQNHKLIETAMKMAKQKGLLVSIDMASFNVVEANLDFLQHLVKNYVDIVFANEEEAKAFTGKEPMEALNEIAKACSIAVVKLGAKGSVIKKENELIKISPINANSIDTTGAGDIYAAGFLYALSQNQPLEKAGQTGSLLAGKIVEVIGAKIPEKKWEQLIKEINR